MTYYFDAAREELEAEFDVYCDSVSETYDDPDPEDCYHEWDQEDGYIGWDAEMTAAFGPVVHPAPFTDDIPF